MIAALLRKEGLALQPNYDKGEKDRGEDKVDLAIYMMTSKVGPHPHSMVCSIKCLLSCWEDATGKHKANQPAETFPVLTLSNEKKPANGTNALPS